MIDKLLISFTVLCVAVSLPTFIVAYVRVKREQAERLRRRHEKEVAQETKLREREREHQHAHA